MVRAFELSIGSKFNMGKFFLQLGFNRLEFNTQCLVGDFQKNDLYMMDFHRGQALKWKTFIW